MLAPLLLLLVVPGAIEDDPAFQEAKAGYQQMNLEGAAELFEGLLERDLEPEDRATVWLWVGLCQADLGHFDRATAAFEEAIQADALVIVPADASPRVQELMNDARRATRARKPSPADAPPGGADDADPALIPAEAPPADEPSPAANGSDTGPSGVDVSVPATAAASQSPAVVPDEGQGSPRTEETADKGFPVVGVSVAGAGLGVGAVALVVAAGGTLIAAVGWLSIGAVAGNAQLSAGEATQANLFGNQLYWGGWVIAGLAVVVFLAGAAAAVTGAVLAFE